jgi:hypothetical protein
MHALQQDMEGGMNILFTSGPTSCPANTLKLLELEVVSFHMQGTRPQLFAIDIPSLLHQNSPFLTSPYSHVGQRSRNEGA